MRVLLLRAHTGKTKISKNLLTFKSKVFVDHTSLKNGFIMLSKVGASLSPWYHPIAWRSFRNEPQATCASPNFFVFENHKDELESLSSIVYQGS